MLIAEKSARSIRHKSVYRNSLLSFCLSMSVCLSSDSISLAPTRINAQARIATQPDRGKGTDNFSCVLAPLARFFLRPASNPIRHYARFFSANGRGCTRSNSLRVPFSGLSRPSGTRRSERLSRREFFPLGIVARSRHTGRLRSGSINVINPRKVCVTKGARRSRCAPTNPSWFRCRKFMGQAICHAIWLTWVFNLRFNSDVRYCDLETILL